MINEDLVDVEIESSEENWLDPEDELDAADLASGREQAEEAILDEEQIENLGLHFEVFLVTV